MSHLSEYITHALAQSENYEHCTPEQALVYACEDLVDKEIGSQVVISREVNDWVLNVCTAEDLDAPHIIVQRATPTLLASAQPETNTICIRGRHTTHATLLHEVAHVSVTTISHDQAFRDEFIRLARRHISVQYAALLHALYNGVGLRVSPWSTTTLRR